MAVTRVVPMKGIGPQTIAKRFDNQARIRRSNIRHSNRESVRTRLHQAPDFKAEILKKRVEKRHATPTVRMPQAKKIAGKKGRANPPSKIPKVSKGVTKKAAKATKAKTPSKKGNDKLVPRSGISQFKVNPFFAKGKKPDYVSTSVYSRWLIRAIELKSSAEMKEFFKSKKYTNSVQHEPFSYTVTTTPELAVCRTRDMAFITEFFKHIKKAQTEKLSNQSEPNLLEYKSSGRSNFYMLGRATRAVEVTRGGREGNNALLKYAGDESGHVTDMLTVLIRENLSYGDLAAISKIPDGPFSEHELEQHVVTAVRVGLCDLAYALAAGVSSHNFNDLHRATLKGKLTSKILPVSVLKKGFMNKSITPIHTAAICNDAKLLEQLRTINPNINIPDQDNWHTIHYAAVCDGTAPLKFLLKNGATVATLTKQAETPLHAAARAGRVENIHIIVKEIMALEKTDGEPIKPARSLINARTRNGLAAIHLAVVHDKMGAVNALLEHETVDVDCPTSTGTNKLTPLMLAAAWGYLDMAENLIAKGALIEGKEKKKRTALIHAALNGQQHVLAMLLAKGANVHATDSSGNSAAHYAAAYGFLDVLRQLAAVDATCLKAENDWKLTPLSVAYLKGHYGIVTWLLDGEFKNDVDINGKDTNGVTLLASLLTYASPAYHVQMDSQIEYLVKRGAQGGITDSSGNTPMHVFAGMKIALKGASGTAANEEQYMSDKQYKKCFDLLIESGASVDAKNVEGQSPMHMALQNGNLMLFEMMLSKVADVRDVFVNWTTDGNILHQLLTLPMTVHATPMLWKTESLRKECYDVLPILNKSIMKFCVDDLQKWLEEPDKMGFPPVIAAMLKYKGLAVNSKIKEAEATEFINTMCETFKWALGPRPEMVSRTYKGTQEKARPVALPHMALKVPIETTENEFALFRRLADFARSKDLLSDFLLLTNEDEENAVTLAADKGNVAAVKLILEISDAANITRGVHDAVKKFHMVDGKKTAINRTLLMTIIQKSMFDLIPLVHVSPEHWKQVDEERNSVWHYAARNNHHRTVSLFKTIEEKKVPRTMNAKGRTALHEATIACDGSANAVLEAITWLSTRSGIADVDMYKRTALHYAFVNTEAQPIAKFVRDPIAVVSVLVSAMQKEHVDMADCKGNTVLHMAAVTNATICAVTLIRKGSEVDAKNSDGNTPLSLAVLYGHQSVALVLIQANASVDEKIFPNAPKEVAAKKDSVWVWEGIEKKVHTAEPTTIPATVVSQGGQWEAMVYVLLDVLGQNTDAMAQLIESSLKRAQFNLANQLLKRLEALLDGKPLICDYDLLYTFTKHFQGVLGSESIELTVLERLIAIGCVVMNSDGTSAPIEVGLEFGSWGALKYFKNKLGTRWAALKPISVTDGPVKAIVLQMTRACVSDSSKLWLEELAKLKNINLNAALDFEIPAQFRSCGLEKLPAICWTSLKGNKDVVRALREAKANLRATDSQGRTALMFAVMANKPNVVDVLLGDGSVYVPAAKTVVAPKNKNHIALLFSAPAKALRKRNSPVPSDDEDEEAEENEEEEDVDEDNADEAEGESGSESNSDDEEDEESPPVRKNNKYSRSKKAAVVQPAGHAEGPPVKKLKIQQTDLFSQKDRQGRSVLHYLVLPIPWENVDLLQMFYGADRAAIKELLTSEDATKTSPIELANNHMQRNMTTHMLKMLGGDRSKKLTRKEVAVERVDDLQCTFDVLGDCKQFLAKWGLEHDQKKKNEVPKPHRRTGYADGGELVFCPDTQQYFNVLLNKTDLSYGRYGFHNFYRMQLIKRRDIELWILFTNWGRIGQGDGEYQSTPFSSLEAGMKEFKSVWKSKTGQDWEPLSNFHEVPKKYRLVEVDSMPTSLAEINLPVVGDKPDKDPVREMIRDVSNAKKLKEYAQSVNFNQANTTCPFGRITADCIARAKSVLDKCEKNAKRLAEMLSAANTRADSDILNVYTKTNELTSEFYSIIPMGDYEFTALQRFDDLDAISKARTTLNRLEEIEVATRLLTGAQFHANVDKIDYIQSALECRFQMEDPKSDVSQRILQYIHNTGGSNVTVQGIIEISPKSSVKRFAPFANDDCQKLLWHGTKAVNMMSILKGGFLVDPQNSTRNGRLFGTGVYLSDAFTKSTHYCEPSVNGVNYMILCQVALGKIKKLTELSYAYGAEQPSVGNENTVHYIGEEHPSGSLTFEGVAIPLMPLMHRKEKASNWGTLPHSEYIVRDAARVLPKYIIIYK